MHWLLIGKLATAEMNIDGHFAYTLFPDSNQDPVYHLQIIRDRMQMFEAVKQVGNYQ